MNTIGSSISSVKVIVRARGAAYMARAGNGEAAKLASSTSDWFYAAEKAAQKFFSQESVELELDQEGDQCADVPAIYIARRKTS